MEKLSTIQKREKLNDVYAVDDIGPGGANHEYIIVKSGCYIENGYVEDNNLMCAIQLQRGPRADESSMQGVCDQDLLEIVKHRLQCFQNGPFATEYNAKALEHLEIALMYLNRRVEDRIERNVLGTYNK